MRRRFWSRIRIRHSVTGRLLELCVCVDRYQFRCKGRREQFRTIRDWGFQIRFVNPRSLLSKKPCGGFRRSSVCPSIAALSRYTLLLSCALREWACLLWNSTGLQNTQPLDTVAKRMTALMKAIHGFFSAKHGWPYAGKCLLLSSVVFERGCMLYCRRSLFVRAAWSKQSSQYVIFASTTSPYVLAVVLSDA